MTMKRWFGRMVLLGCVALVVVWSGCSKEEAEQSLKKAEQTAEDAAKSAAQEVGEVLKKGEEAASELGEKALAYLTPLKEKLANLDSLKDSPEQLKQAVTELIETIDGKAEDIQLPEKVSAGLATVKEKLTALRDYLEGEVEQAKIGEHIQEIMDTVKSELGMNGQ